jgi:hypothetical protein
MTRSTQWNRLHDATLKRIVFEFEENVCDITLALSAVPPCTGEIRAVGILKLLLPRASPWGYSNSVNRVFLSENQSDGSSTLNIEMQSGDVLLIEAKSLSFVVNS